MSLEPLPHDEKYLRDKLQNDPSDWETRRRLAHALYDRSAFGEAAEVVWMADQIPSTDIDLAFAARILSKAQPRKAIRLLAAVLELNRGKAVQNMGMANALLHHGMVLQSARFYGAALEADPTLVNPDLEHFILWTDDEMRLWADFSERRPKLGELPWMARDPMEALKLTSRISLHTTPISVPSLQPVAGEELRRDLYQQEATRNGKITPPPAVTIPIDRVDPKHRLFDDRYGATVTGGDEPVAVVNPVVEPSAAPQPRVLLTGPGHTPARTAPVASNMALPAPVATPMSAPTSISIPVPMAIPVPDHVVPVAPSIVSAVPTVPISPPAPSRAPASVPGMGVVTAAPTPGRTQQAATPTRRLLTPGVKPAGMNTPGVASPTTTGPLTHNKKKKRS